MRRVHREDEAKERLQMIRAALHTDAKICQTSPNSTTQLALRMQPLETEICMFESLKKRWQDASSRVDAENQAKELASRTAPGNPQGLPDMIGLARQFAATLSDKGLAVDFTPASLATIDQVLQSAKSELAAMSIVEIADRKRLATHAALNMGAYVGEVLRSDEGGLWTKGPDGLPAVDLGWHVASPIAAVLGLLTQGRVAMPSGFVETLVAYHQLIASLSHAELEDIVRGKHETLTRLQRDMSENAELATWLSNHARIAVKTARTKWNALLDFTPASLQAVENVLAQLHDVLQTAPPDDRPTEQQIELAAKVWGVYVGEVVRRHMGGKWALSEGVLQLEINDARLFPLRKVQKRLIDGPGDAIPFYFNAVKAQLASSS